MLVGEAGIGKSRIAEELIHLVEQQNHAVLRLQCAPAFSDTPHWPVAQALKRQIAGVWPDGTDTPVQRFDAFAAAGALDRPEARAALADFLGVDMPGRADFHRLAAARQRSVVQQALVDVMIGRGRQGPLLILVEDMHWADPSTLEFLELLIGASAGSSTGRSFLASPAVTPLPWMRRSSAL